MNATIGLHDNTIHSSIIKYGPYFEQIQCIFLSFLKTCSFHQPISNPKVKAVPIGKRYDVCNEGDEDDNATPLVIIRQFLQSVLISLGICFVNSLHTNIIYFSIIIYGPYFEKIWCIVSFESLSKPFICIFCKNLDTLSFIRSASSSKLTCPNEAENYKCFCIVSTIDGHMVRVLFIKLSGAKSIKSVPFPELQCIISNVSSYLNLKRGICQSVP